MLYKAFISYSHAANDKLVQALQSALQTFAKPWYRLRSIRVFRDKTTLSANPALWPSIETALHESEYFLLLASPEAARSPWVKREVEWWLRNRSIETMLILLTDGELIWDKTTNDYNWERTTALPDCLRKQFKDEPFYVDLRWAKTENNLSLRHSQFRSAILDIAPTLYGKAKDELDGEDVRQYKRNRRWAWSAAVVLSIATVSAISGAFYAYKQREVAEEQRNVAVSRLLASQAELIEKQQANLLPQSVLLAAEALEKSPSFAADQAMYHSLSLLGPKPIVQRSYRGLSNLVLSPYGKYLVQLPYDGPAEVLETVSGKSVASLIHFWHDNTPLEVRQVSFNTDEHYVATLSSLGVSAIVWALPRGRKVFQTPENRSGITAIALSGSGKYLATGHTDGMVFLWKVSTGNEILSFSHSDIPRTIKFSPDGRFLAVCSSLGFPVGPPTNSMVQLWDVVKNKEIAKLRHASAVTHLTFSPNSKYLAITSRVGQEQAKEKRIGTVKVWEVATGQEVTQIQHEDAVNSLIFTPNSKYLLTGSTDDTSRLWDVINGHEMFRVNHESTIDIADFLKIDDFYFSITAGGDGIVRLWGSDLPVEELLRLPESPNILAFAQNADGQYLTTISYNLKTDASVPVDQYRRDVRVWTTASLRKVLSLRHEHAVESLRFSRPNGRYLATLDYQMPSSKLIPKTEKTEAHIEYTDLGSGNISLWEVSTRKRIAHLKHPGTVMSFDYDSKGKHIATACVDGVVRVWEALSGKEIAQLKLNGWVYVVAFSPNGRYVATSSGSSKLLEGKKGIAMVTIWEWQTGRTIGHLKSDYLISTIDFSPKGKLLSAGGLDGTVHILRAADAQEVQQLHDDDAIQALSFSPDGRYVATASGGPVPGDSALSRGTTTLWKVNDAKKTVLRKHRSWVTTVTFSPDGKSVASMDQNGIIGIWATADGHEIASMKDDGFVPQAKISFSPNGKYLATAFGNKAQIWKVATGKEVSRREHRRGNMLDVAFSPNGRYLVTASTDHTASLWLWHSEDLVSEACERLTRNLTHAEWRQYVGEEVPYHATCANLVEN